MYMQLTTTWNKLYFYTLMVTADDLDSLIIIIVETLVKVLNGRPPWGKQFPNRSKMFGHPCVWSINNYSYCFAPIMPISRAYFEITPIAAMAVKSLENPAVQDDPVHSYGDEAYKRNRPYARGPKVRYDQLIETLTSTDVRICALSFAGVCHRSPLIA